MKSANSVVGRALHRVYGSPRTANRRADAKTSEGRRLAGSLARRVCGEFGFDDLAENLDLLDESDVDTVVLDECAIPPWSPRHDAAAAAPSSAAAPASAVEDEGEIETVVIERPAGLAPMRPGWELPRFTWPAAAERIIKTLGDPFQSLAVKLGDASQQLGPVAFAGVSSGAGCTMLTIAVAKSLVDAGRTCCLVDAHFMSPDLAFRLGVSPKSGWDGAWSEPQRINAFVVHEEEHDSLLLPLTKSITRAESRLESMAPTIEPLLAQFAGDSRATLIDAGVAPADETLAAAWLAHRPWIKGLVLVDRLGGAAAARAAIRDACRQTNIRFLGVLENTADGDAATSTGDPR